MKCHVEEIMIKQISTLKYEVKINENNRSFQTKIDNIYFYYNLNTISV